MSRRSCVPFAEPSKRKSFHARNDSDQAERSLTATTTTGRVVLKARLTARVGALFETALETATKEHDELTSAENMDKGETHQLVVHIPV